MTVSLEVFTIDFFEELSDGVLTFDVDCDILIVEEISFAERIPSFGLGRSRPLIRPAVSLALFMMHK